MEILTGILAAFGLSASAGLNAYIPLLTIGLLARYTDLVQLTKPWNTLENGWVIALLILLSVIEFFADKIPAVNHVNDGIQTFVRPAAGAIAFAASANIISDIHPVVAIIAGILISGGVHAVKSTTVRPAVTATTGGVGNVPVSMAEDILATVTSLLALIVPLIFAFIFLLLATWLAWLVWKRSARVKRIQSA